VNARDTSAVLAALKARTRLLAEPLKAARLAPLSAAILAGLAGTTLCTGLFALYAAIGPVVGDDGAAAPDWTPPTLAVVDLEPPKSPNADVETLARPIFTKSRRPTPKGPAGPARAAQEADAGQPSGLTLTAVVRRGKNAQAFITGGNNPDGDWRKVGDSIDSWTVSEISPTEVTLKSNGQSAKLKLYDDKPQEPADPATAANPDPTAVDPASGFGAAPAPVTPDPGGPAPAPGPVKHGRPPQVAPAPPPAGGQGDPPP
jgi:hypothetical protein